jgi:small-conductance mechanosensitive channel
MKELLPAATLGIVLSVAVVAAALVAARVGSALVHRVWRAGYDPERHLAVILSMFRLALLLGASSASVMLLMPVFQQMPVSGVLLLGGALLLAGHPLLQNILAGLYLVARGDVREGDRIRLGAMSGMVREVGLGRVRVREDDGSGVLVPNRLLLRDPMRVQRASGRARIEVSLSPTHTERADLTRIREIAHLCPYRVVSTPVAVSKHDSNVLVEIQAWRPRCHSEVLDYLEAALERPKAPAKPE